MNTILVIGLLSILSIGMAKLLNKFKLPSVTGYLLAGLLIGPSILNIISKDYINNLNFISELALGLIAFHIGESFEIKQIKKLAKSVITITFLQAIITVIVVFTILILITNDMAFSIVISAISAATAPAATVMVIKEYHAKGTLTNTLLSVVAMDDVVCIILYSLATSIASILTAGSISLHTALITPCVEIFGSILLGSILGFFIIKIITRKSPSETLVLLPMSIIIFAIGISIKYSMSSLLTCATMGAIVANKSKVKNKIFNTTNYLSTFICMLFFTISGTSLDVNVLKKLSTLGILYIVTRAVGKFIGAYIGCMVTKTEKKIKNYLGFGLLPQAGVAIGLATLSASKFPNMGTKILNLIMAAVFIYELVGPILTKQILISSGEAKEKD